MTTVRPPIFPQAQGPSVQQPRSPAQQAFFAAAAGRAAPQAPAAPAIHVQRVPANLPADPPERILRPGSLLDIKV